MKPVLIIVFELKTPSANQELIVREIKKNDWIRLTTSAYFVSTEKTPVEIRDAFKVLLQTGDALFVGTAPAPSAWVGFPETTSAWIIEHQVGPPQSVATK